MMKKWLLASLTLVIVACQEQFVFPDEFEAILQQIQRQHQQLQQKLQQQQQQLQYQQEQLQMKLQQQRLIEGFLNLPAFPTFRPFASGGFQVAGPLPMSVGDLYPQSPAGIKPSIKTFDNFLAPRWKEHVLNIISRGVAKFTLDMDRTILDSANVINTDNLLFSPVSLSVTFAMVMLAAGGKTFEEVAKILGLESGVDISHNSEIVHQIFGLLLQETERKHMLNPDLPQSNLAFGIFLQDGYPVREVFRTVSEKFYKTEVISVDFLHRSREAKEIVNDWISKRTNGKIKTVLNQQLNPLTNVIITSALHFAGAWAQPFSRGNTQRQPFYIEPNQSVFADMMTNGGDFPYYEDSKLGLKIVGFPYRGNEGTIMYAVLPNAPGRAALRKMKNRLSPEILDELINKTVNRPCIIKYPRMQLSSTLHLRSALQALGLNSLFDPSNADLSVLSPGQKKATGQRTNSAAFQPTLQHFRPDFQPCYTIFFGRCKRQSRPIDQEFVEYLKFQKLPNFDVDNLRNSAGLSNPGLYADDVIHRVEMTINEKGTEAAAATSVTLDRSGDYKWFIANRPFLFFIRHDPTRIIWFWGTINRPTPFFDSV